MRHGSYILGAARAVAQVSANMLRRIAGSPQISATRAERNDARKWAATAGSPGGSGSPTVSAFMEARRLTPKGMPRPADTYRGARRAKAKADRRASVGA